MYVAQDIQTGTIMDCGLLWMSADDSWLNVSEKLENIITWMKDTGLSNFRDG